METFEFTVHGTISLDTTDLGVAMANSVAGNPTDPDLASMNASFQLSPKLALQALLLSAVLGSFSDKLNQYEVADIDATVEQAGHLG